MAIPSTEISGLVEAYLAAHPDEADRIALLAEAIAGGGDVTSRTVAPGHVTTGAFLLDADGRLLQIAHKALGRWLNPGGHCEPDDASLPEAALRELTEETGIPARDIELLPEANGGALLDIDVHLIPANPAKGEPEHWHYDFRFAFRLTGAGPIDLQVEEVDGHRWVPVPEAELGIAAAKLSDSWLRQKGVAANM
jgi:8-oxo-dGTP pyrophosphatase MutT (NUDIX family)